MTPKGISYPFDRAAHRLGGERVLDRARDVAERDPGPVLASVADSSADPDPVSYPAPVAPDGPGSLADELGEVPAGTWTIRAIDAVGGTAGTLDTVTLRILHPDPAGGVSGPAASPLRLVREGSDVVATFGPAPGAVAHELAKAPLPTLEGLAGVATTNTASARESGGAVAAGSHYYVVRGLDTCGRPGP
jgi:hypothetical protein